MPKKPQNTMSEDDLEKVVQELRYVLKNAASKDEIDSKIIMELTKTIEDVNVSRLDRRKQWDPSYGKVDTRDEDARREALMRGLEQAERRLPKKRRVGEEKGEREGFSLSRILRSFIKRLGGED
jgi:Asp-tRNA(Asn)/Glu-tRNA(Gln) amidotransferase C subunit